MKMKTSAMIFAAGLGTRLYPLTQNMPKALLSYNNRPLLEHVIQKIIAAGIQHIVINVHHFADQIISFLADQNFAADIVISDESAQILDTGGGLKFAEQAFAGSDRILLYNVDIISSINIVLLLDHHTQSGALATLVVKKRPTERCFIFEKNTMQLCGWRHETEKKELYTRPVLQPVALAFSGIHVVNVDILQKIECDKKQSLTAVYLHLAQQETIMGYLHQEDQWMDMGKDVKMYDIAK